jgi:hypothetical protein
MVDRTFRKLLGQRSPWTLALAVLAAWMSLPSAAQAASGAAGALPQVSSITEMAVNATAGVVPPAAQAAVNTALANAAAAEPAVAPAAVPVTRSPSSRASQVPSVSLPAVSVPVPAVSSSATTPVVTVPGIHVEAPSSTPQIESIAVGAAPPVEPSAAVAGVSAIGPRRVSRSGGSAPSGRIHHAGASQRLAVRNPHRAGPRRPVIGRMLALAAATAPPRADASPAFRSAHPLAAPRPHLAAPRHTPRASLPAPNIAAATPIGSPVPDSLPSTGTEGPGAGAGTGAGGAAAIALLALAAIALLRAFLPGLVTLDLPPWRSAILALPLERPG